MNSDGVLTAKDIMNYEFCPRIIYFEHVLKESQKTTFKEIKGREKHSQTEVKSRRNKIVKNYPKLPRRYRVRLFSKKHNFETVLDCLLINDADGEAYPIQFKHAFKPSSIFRTQKIQLVAEAVLVKEQLGYAVPHGYIKYLKSGDLAKVSITPDREDDFCYDVSEINRIIKNETIPEPTQYPKRCADCCFLNICRRA